MWNGTYITTRPEWRLVSEGKYYPRGHLRKIKMHIYAQSKDKPIIEFMEEHVHRAYSETQIRRTLYHAKFRDVAFTKYDSRMFSDLDDEYMFKLVCIARK